MIETPEQFVRPVQRQQQRPERASDDIYCYERIRFN